MRGSILFLWIVCLQLMFVLITSKPVAKPENADGLELLSAKDTLPYVFWFRRPVYDQDYDGGDNTYYNLQLDRRSSTFSYANVGAGWGR